MGEERAKIGVEKAICVRAAQFDSLSFADERSFGAPAAPPSTPAALFRFSQRLPAAEQITKHDRQNVFQREHRLKRQFHQVYNFKRRKFDGFRVKNLICVVSMQN